MPINFRPLKILYVVPGYKPAYRIGGPILSVSSAAEHLVSRGHKVIVFTSNANLDQDIDVPLNQPVMVKGVEVWYFKRYEPLQMLFPFIPYLSQSLGFLYTPSLPRYLYEILDDLDIVHTHMPFVYPTQFAGRTAVKLGKPLFYQQRSVFDPEKLKYRKFKKSLYITLIEKPIMRKATTLIALTESECESYRALGVNTICQVIPNGIDVDKYFQEADKGSLNINSHCIDESQLVILFLGRLHTVKGADILLKSFIQIAPQFPRSVLILAGPDQHGLKDQMMQLVRTYDLVDRVLFPGMVEGEQKLKLLSRANLFCLPSAAEGFSMAILEALASSTPVMITPGCHFPEVEIHDAGWVVDRNVDHWANWLSNIMHNPTQLIPMRISALRLVKSCYTWEKVTNTLEEVYKEGLLRQSQLSK